MWVFTRCMHMSVCDSVTHIVTSKHHCLVAMADGFNKAELQIASCISFPSLSPLFFFKSFFSSPLFSPLLLLSLFLLCVRDNFSSFSLGYLFYFLFVFLLLAFHYCTSDQCCLSPVSLLFYILHSYKLSRHAIISFSIIISLSQFLHFCVCSPAPYLCLSLSRRQTVYHVMASNQGS